MRPAIALKLLTTTKSWLVSETFQLWLKIRSIFVVSFCARYIFFDTFASLTTTISVYWKVKEQIIHLYLQVVWIYFQR